LAKVLAGNTNKDVTEAVWVSILKDEKIPDAWKKSENGVTFPSIVECIGALGVEKAKEAVKNFFGHTFVKPDGDVAAAGSPNAHGAPNPAK